MTKLDFYDPNNQEYMIKLGAKILEVCNGKNLEEILERINMGISPNKIKELLQFVKNIEGSNAVEDILDGLIPSVASKEIN